jgi:hypothetical protein
MCCSYEIPCFQCDYKLQASFHKESVNSVDVCMLRLSASNWLVYLNLTTPCNTYVLAHLLVYFILTSSSTASYHGVWGVKTWKETNSTASFYSAPLIISWAMNVHGMADDVMNCWIYVVAGSFKDAQIKFCPPHPGYCFGLCTKYGNIQDEEDVSGVHFGYIHKVPGILSSLFKHERFNGVSLLHLPCLIKVAQIFEQFSDYVSNTF